MHNPSVGKQLDRIEKLLLENMDVAKILINTTHGVDGLDSIIISAANPEFEKPKMEEALYQ